MLGFQWKVDISYMAHSKIRLQSYPIKVVIQCAIRNYIWCALTKLDLNEDKPLMYLFTTVDAEYSNYFRYCR